MDQRDGEGAEERAAALTAPRRDVASKIIQMTPCRYRKKDSSSRSIASTAESEAVSLAV